MQLGIREDGSIFAVIHLEVGKRLACAPGETDLCALPTRGHPMQRTDDARAVTCHLCRATKAWHNVLQAIMDGIESGEVVT